MAWTAERVILGARDLAPEFRDRSGGVPDALIRFFNNELEALLQEIVEADPEAVLDTYVIPNAVVDAGTDIDLTDDGADGTRDWLHIEMIEVVDEDDEVLFEVNIPPSTAARAERYEVESMGEEGVVGHYIGERRKLRKVTGWQEDVGWTLRVYGVLAPAEATEANLSTLEYTYPRGCVRALTYLLGLLYASHIGLNLNERTMMLWSGLMNDAREKLGLEATRWPRNEQSGRPGGR